MGSAVLREAISAIRDWSMTEGKESRGSASRPKRSAVWCSTTRRSRSGCRKPVYHALRRTITHGEALDPSVADAVAGGDEGLGGRARRDALHALVPAADRHHRREARLVSDRRPATARRSRSSRARS